jgi:tetratricopeptide (TPR) repeat protein
LPISQFPETQRISIKCYNLNGIKTFPAGKIADQLASKGNIMDAQMDLAYDLYKCRKFAKAVDLYEAVISQEPENARAYLGLSDSLYYLKEYKRSYEAVQKAAALQPDLVQVHYRKAAIFYKWKQIHESEDEIKSALELDPNSSDSLTLLAGIQF